MKNLIIKDIIPQKAESGSSTPNRKLLKVIFQEITENGVLITEKTATRVVGEEYSGIKSTDGKELNLKADPLFTSICEIAGINENNIQDTNWKNNKLFFKAFNMKVIKSFKSALELMDKSEEQNVKRFKTTSIGSH